MRVLHAYNLHRGGGGADNATRATIDALRRAGTEIEIFERDSRDIPDNLVGKFGAFASGLYARTAVRAFAEQLDAFRPELVHVHELYPLISPWVLPQCSRRGIPVVLSVYDYRLSCPTHNHFRAGSVCTDCLGGNEHRCMLRNCRGSRAESTAFSARSMLARALGLFSRHVAMYLTPTQFTADWLTAHCAIPANRTAVIPCVIDLPPDTVDPSAGAYVAFAGRFVEEKGVSVALEAARLAGLPIRLAVDGLNCPDPASSALVTFVRTASRGELANFYRGARCFVMPSIWFETFGIVVAEAMSHGIPVLASRIGALAETTRDGVSGLLFEPGNARDLAEKMTLLWNDGELCRRLGLGGRAQVVEQCSEQRHTELMLAAYRAAASRTTAR